MKKSNVVVLAIWKQERGIPYKPTFYKNLAKVYLFPTQKTLKEIAIKKEKKAA